MAAFDPVQDFIHAGPPGEAAKLSGQELLQGLALALCALLKGGVDVVRKVADEQIRHAYIMQASAAAGQVTAASRHDAGMALCEQMRAHAAGRASDELALSVRSGQSPDVVHQVRCPWANPHGAVFLYRRRERMGVRMLGTFRPCRGPASTPERFDGPFLDLVGDGSDSVRQRLGSHREDALRGAVRVVQHRRHLSWEIRPLLVTDVRERRTAGAQVAQHRRERLRQCDVHEIPPGGATDTNSLNGASCHVAATRVLCGTIWPVYPAAVPFIRLLDFAAANRCAGGGQPGAVACGDQPAVFLLS